MCRVYSRLHDWSGLFQKRHAGIAGPAVSLDPTHGHAVHCIKHLHIVDVAVRGPRNNNGRLTY
jgi:hypothetical protein